MNYKNSSLPEKENPNDLLKSKEVKARLGYKDNGAFWDLVHRQSIPCIRLNSKNIIFRRGAVDDWLRQRSVG